MKYVFIYLMFFLWPQQGYSRAYCPANMTQEECCAQDSTMTLSACNASCSGTCSLGYYGGCYKCQGGVIDNTGTTSCKTGCKKCGSTSTSCTECYSGYRLVNGVCYKCSYSTAAACQAGVNNCKSCSAYGTGCYLCSTCNDGYGWEMARSYSGDYINPTQHTVCYSCYRPHCILCGGDQGVGVCTKCESGYYATGYNGNDSCRICPANGTCTDGINLNCNKGYYKSGSSYSGYSCYSCPSNCTECSSASVCTACADGYELSGGKCVAQTNTVSSCPPYTTKSSDGCCCIPD